MHRIELLVEGEGEVGAVPSLLSKFLDMSRFYFGNPIKVGTAPSLKNRMWFFQKMLKTRLAYDPDYILYVSDSDEECPLELARIFYDAAAETLTDIPSPPKFAVLIMKPDYESLFLVSLDCFDESWTPILEDDLPNRRCKQFFKSHYDQSYKESRDQKGYTSRLRTDAVQRCRSGVHIARVADWISNAVEGCENYQDFNT